MSAKSKRELDDILAKTRHLGYQPMAIVFYDPKLKMLGLAPLSDVPEAVITEIGNRLGKVVGSVPV